MHPSHKELFRWPKEWLNWKGQLFLSGYLEKIDLCEIFIMRLMSEPYLFFTDQEMKSNCCYHYLPHAECRVGTCIPNLELWAPEMNKKWVLQSKCNRIGKIGAGSCEKESESYPVTRWCDVTNDLEKKVLSQESSPSWRCVE